MAKEGKTKTDRYDAAIVGGGAAGMVAAVSYLRRASHGRLIVIEANDVCGKKLLATGNGRCNISNLSADNYSETKDFFRSVGVLFRVEEGGRAYPMSGQAASVRSALVFALERERAEIRCGARVSRVENSDEGFMLFFEEGAPVLSKRLLVATGGKAGPQYGCFGDGYSIARSLGHSVESIRPALVPLLYTEKEKGRLGGLAGVRIRTKAELLIDGKCAAASSGELQMTKYGLSGVMIFDLSTMMPKSIIEGRPRTEILLDFVPGEEAAALEGLILENKGLWLEGIVGKKLSDLLVRESGVYESGVESGVDESGGASRIAALAKNFRVSVCGTKGWKEAQSTLGGIRTAEVNEKTGESLICKGLFFAGELLDPVFICGGFNLNHAWATGLRAGENL